MKSALVVAVLIGAFASNASASNFGENVIYVGSGSAETGSDPYTNKKAPFSVGYLRLSNTSDTVWGFDIGGEGTKLDSTWGQDNAVKQANSFNLILGKNIGKTENSRYDLSAIIGFRHKTTSCPSSYLGYQCYADAQPDTSYAFNYGMAFTVYYKQLMLGVRATGESKQALIGVRF